MDIIESCAEAFIIHRPSVQTAPIVLASAHSGRCYRPDFIESARLEGLALRRSEDSFVDELFAAGPDLGVPLLCATFPRAFCDANREAWELDPSMFEDALPAHVNAASPRVAAGLGTIARIVSSGETIYRHKLRFAEAEWRIDQFWQPYHRALADLISETRARFGACLVLDCHSMPGHHGVAPSIDIVLGDAHGTTCRRSVTNLVESTLREDGFSVRRNEPYAGGYVTRHYGKPREGVHVLQLEIARPLYMNERLIEKSACFARIQEAMSGLTAILAARIQDLLS